MKVLLINDYGTPTGGAERMQLMLRDTLRRRGHDARLLSSSALAGGGASQADYTCAGTTGRFRTALQTFNLSAAREMRRVLGEFRPDVVHVKMFLTQLSPLILPPLRDVPAIYHVVWYRPICPTGTKTLPDGRACEVRAGWACCREGCVPLRDWPLIMTQMKLWRRWRERAFDVIVANSQAMRKHLVDEGIEPVEVIHNGIPQRAARPPLSDPPTVAAAGRLVKEKGFDVLLRAFARVLREVPNAKLILAGDGPARESLAALVEELRIGASAQMTGHLPGAELERISGSAWVQAVPSTWAEPFGLVAPEAMMRGTAVIASSSGGLAEIVRHEQTGLSIPPGDENALTASLLRLLRDRDLSERMGAAGRQVALEHFTEDIFTDRFVALYQRLVGKGNG